MINNNKYRLKQFAQILEKYEYPKRTLEDALSFINSEFKDGTIVLSGVGYCIIPMALSVARRIDNNEIYTLVSEDNAESERGIYQKIFKKDIPAKFHQIITDEPNLEGRRWKSSVRKKIDALVINDFVHMNAVIDFFMMWRSNIKTSGYVVIFNLGADVFPGVQEAVDYFLSNTLTSVYARGDMVILKNTRSKL